jgi:uncharacterized protein with HEPN domain
MLESAQAVRGYVAGLSFEQFWDDYKTRDAVAMRLIVLGEASRHIDDATAAKLPTIPFSDIRATRNRIAHDYSKVNFRIVWEISQKDIPPLIAALETHFAPKPPPS